ncbi:MAG: serine/threonine protein kinase [Verrucomicrobia bacterium]|nr:serine/threonine protein kinase [Verrucomicrobiota bacterium]
MASVADFDHLTPELAMTYVEDALGKRLTSLYRPMNSYINRVFELECEDGSFVVAKFYRPRRWSVEALREEHAFLLELAAAEIPVIPPLRGPDDQTLFEADGMHFALFEKKGGRVCDEPNPEQWRMLGRLLARIHQVGESHPASHRIQLSPVTSTRDHLTAILDAGVIDPVAGDAYEDCVLTLIDEISPLFDDNTHIRIHGDCHMQNMIHRPGEGFFAIDFDDMAMGPPIQDIWMLLPGRVVDARREMAMLIDGYELFREFDDTQLQLVEPLRAMRFIHYTAWCARQVADGGFTRLAPDWGSPSFWQQEIRDLERQMDEIDDACGSGERGEAEGNY